MDASGLNIAFSSYAIAGVISMLTAAVMWIAVKIMQRGNKRREQKK